MQNLQLITRDGVEYITSTALAKFFNKQHKHILRDIREMEPKWFEAFKQEGPNLGCPDSFLQVDVQVPMPNGRGFKTTKEYALTRDQALYVATKYDDVMRAKLVQDWVVTKAQVITNELPQDYLSALKALVASEEAKLLLEAKVQETEVKNQALEKENSELDNLIAVTEAENNILRSEYLKRAEVEHIIRWKCDGSGHWYDILVRNLAKLGYISKCKGYGYIQLKGKAYFTYIKGSTKIHFYNTKAAVKWLTDLVIDIDAPKVCK